MASEPRLPTAGRSNGYRFAFWLLPRLLGLVYAIAFLSLWGQVHGLIGSRGILPLADFLTRVDAVLGAERFWKLPTLFWLWRDDAALTSACALGCAAAGLAISGRMQRPALALCWLLYLSLVSVGQDFLSFQWDVLLLEAGLLGVLAVPAGRTARLADTPEAPVLARWLVWLLGLRLFVLSGFVKLASGDEAWSGLTALGHHYETQPLPTWMGWWAHQLPTPVQQASVVAMFAVELAVPWLLLVGRRPRRWAAWILVAFQGVIAMTGNYTFFNLLSAGLCLTWIGDEAWPKAVRRRLGPEPLERVSRWRPRLVVAAGSVLALLATLVTARAVGLGAWLPRPATALVAWTQPLRSVNSYGLFAVMTTRRPEIVLEASADGGSWRELELPWKPGDLERRPRFVAPHQPRLDWQLWFAALAGPSRTHWFPALMDRVLEGSPSVLDLFAADALPDGAPAYLRARLYDYRFTSVTVRRETGRWWYRVPLGTYAAPRSRTRDPRASAE